MNQPGMIQRRKGERRRMTIYLPPSLAQKLKDHAHNTHSEMSTIVEAAVSAWLESKEAAAESMIADLIKKAMEGL